MPDFSDYRTVPERIEEFRAKYPDGRLRPVDPVNPFRVVEIAGRTFVAYAALAYRTPDDPLPGCGCAWEPFPGPTAFTRDSELQNAETSAWGRAIVAALIADAKKGVATREDIEARNGEVLPEEGSRVMTSGHALAEAAARAGFTVPRDASDEDKREMDSARRDVLEAATGHRSSKALTTAAEVKAALDAFNGLVEKTVEFGYDEDGVPTLRALTS